MGYLSHDLMQADSRFKPTKATLASLLMCSMLMLMGGAAVAPALPAINQIFEGQDFAVSLIITLPSLAVALSGFAMGALADRFGKVRTLSVSLLIFTFAGVASFFLDDLNVILVARFIVGIGIAGITSAVTALLAEYYTGMDRVRAMSYQSAAMGVGVLILEFTGGTLAEYGWRIPFLVYLIGIPILMAVILTMREPVPMDQEGTVLENHTVDRRVIISCYVAVFLMMTMMFLIPTKIPYFLSDVGISSSLVGLFLGVHGVVNAIVCLMYRRIVQVMQPFMMIGLGFLIMGLSLLILWFVPTAMGALAMLVAVSLGMGMVSPAISNTLASQVTPSTSGKVMGGYGMCLNLGQFSISLLVVPIYAAVGSSYPALFATMSIVAFVVAAAFIGNEVLRSRNARANAL